MGVALFLVGLAGALPAGAQTTPAGSTNTFSLTTSSLSLPGGGHTVVGTEAGVTMQLTPNFALRESNLLAPGSNFQFFGGGFNYYLPPLSAKLNNASPTLNGYRFLFHITASAGVDRITLPSGTVQHYAFKAGGGLDYDLTNSGRWTFGAEIEYAKFPGLQNNTWIVKVGPALHF